MLEGPEATTGAAAALLGALTLAIGRRFIIIDGVERWKEDEVSDQLAPLLAAMPDDTTIAFFAREEGRRRLRRPFIGRSSRPVVMSRPSTPSRSGICRSG